MRTSEVIHPRMARFIQLLPKHNYNITKAGREAGYSESYILKQGKTLMRNATKAQARAIQDATESKEITSKESKRLMMELVGMSREDVMERIKYIASQDKDLNSALKVLAPLAKELGVILNPDDEARTVMPSLNVGIIQVEPNNPPTVANVREIESSDGVIDKG